MEKSGRHHFNWVIKVNIINSQPNGLQMPPYRMHWGYNITYVALPPKRHNLNLIMREYQTNQIEGYSGKYMAWTLQKKKKKSMTWKAE